jgi:hypothetical protein
MTKDAWATWHRRLHEQKQLGGLFVLCVDAVEVDASPRSSIGVCVAFEYLVRPSGVAPSLRISSERVQLCRALPLYATALQDAFDMAPAAEVQAKDVQAG